MKSVFEYYNSVVTDRPNMKGGRYAINMLPTTCHVYFGEVMMASANGRLAHKPVSEGLNHMADVVKTYFNMDGHHIQFNVIDKETLLKAQQNPDEYKDLIVRVAGYSDHFRNLSKALQDEIIDRTEQNFN